MRCADVNSFLRIVTFEEAVCETRGEAVAATDAVFDEQAVEAWALIELVFFSPVHDCGPVVFVCVEHFAEGCADDFKVGIIFGDLADHFFVVFDWKIFKIFIFGTFDFVAEDFLEVFFVADETVDVLNERFGCGDSFFA